MRWNLSVCLLPLLSFLTAGEANAACATWHHLTNGTTADADDVMDNFDCLTTNPEFTGQVTVRTDTGSGPSTVRIVNATDGTGSAARIDLAGGSTGNLSELTFMQFAPSHSGSLLGLPMAGLSAVFENTHPSLCSGLALGTVASHPVTLGTDNAARVTVTGSGDVGIGTTSPSYTLHVNGSVAGVGAYNNLSDARLKKNVVPIRGAMARVNRLQGVYFDWRRPAERLMGEGVNLPVNQRQIGFLAQDLKNVLPEAVSVASDKAQTMSVAESKVVPLLVEAMKELQAANRDLGNTVRAQSAELVKLRRDVAALQRSRLAKLN